MNYNKIRTIVMRASMPAIQLISANQGLSSLTKIGGLPDVPDQFVWPMWKDKPLVFLAQIDLDNMQTTLALPGFPKSGMLYFFYDDAESTWGFDPEDIGSWRVIYGQFKQELISGIPPAEMGSDRIYPQKYVEPKLIQSFPSFARLRISDKDQDALDDFEQELRNEFAHDEPEHQLGGFPNPLQDDMMELECQLASNGINCGNPSGYHDPRASSLAKGASEWKLLLQLDSDDDVNMMWGDEGRLYFWIRDGDLRKKDFANVWMILQCG